MPKSRRVGAIKCKKHFKIMKPNRFLLLFSLLLAANAVAYFTSCRQDEAETLTSKPNGAMAATERGICTSAGYCDFTITSTTDANIEFCGDIQPNTGFCNYGCLPNSDASLSAALTANVPRTICVLNTGSVCVRNSPTAVLSINVTVFFGTGGTINVTLAPGQSQCFHSNGTCDATISGCI